MSIDRRRFLALAGAALAGAALPACGRAPGDSPARSAPRAAREGLKRAIAVARGGDAAARVRAALESLGGLGRIVRRGETVLVKPNIAWARTPEQAANTSPEVVEAVVRLALEAGAGRVIVLDNPCNDARRSYQLSGIAEAAARAGAEVPFLNSASFDEVRMPEGAPFPSWKIARTALEADVIVNVPIAKHHSLARATLGVKNLMGLLGGSRGEWHRRLPEATLALQSLLKPAVTILDAGRVLMAHGPQGGRVEDVREVGAIAASADAFAIEAFGAEILGARPEEVPLLRLARERGLATDEGIERVETRL